MRIIQKAILFFSVALAFQVNSQNYLGIYGSNYSGVMGTDIQPASFVDSRFVVDVNLASFSGAAWNNGMSFTTKDMPKWWVKSFTPDSPGYNNPYNNWISPDSTFMDRYISRSFNQNSTKLLGVYNNVQVDVLNFMFHIKPTIAIGLAIKVRSITNVDDIDPKLAMLLDKDWNISTLWNQKFNEK